MLVTHVPVGELVSDVGIVEEDLSTPDDIIHVLFDAVAIRLVDDEIEPESDGAYRFHGITLS